MEDNPAAAKKIKRSVEQLRELGEGELRSAVALRYDVGKDAAPMIVAGGKGLIADEILRIAEENSIPLFQDEHLANLLSKLEMDTQVPSELYVLVAEVLAFVYRLEQMANKRMRVQEEIKKLPPKP